VLVGAAIAFALIAWCLSAAAAAPAVPWVELTSCASRKGAAAVERGRPAQTRRTNAAHKRGAQMRSQNACTNASHKRGR